MMLLHHIFFTSTDQTFIVGFKICNRNQTFI